MSQNHNGGPRLSIIIVSYNTKEITDQCLASIYASEWHNSFEIIVVDNNSGDGSVDMIKSKYPEVKLIENKENRYFAIANNQGAKIASGEYVLLLNSDTIVYGDNLQKMIDYYDTLPENVICIGPKVLNKDKTIQSYGAAAYGYAEHFICQLTLHKKFKLLGKIWKTLPNPDKTHPVGWVSGCCMMIRKNLYDKVGGLNEKLEFYGEEPEFGFRTQKMGYKTIYYKDAEIVHLGGASTKPAETTTKGIESDLKRYDCLVRETNGYSEAIMITHITNFANRIKRIAYRKTLQSYFNGRIEHEKRVIVFLKKKRHEHYNK